MWPLLANNENSGGGFAAPNPHQSEHFCEREPGAH
jgi:hypothetical protein